MGNVISWEQQLAERLRRKLENIEGKEKPAPADIAETLDRAGMIVIAAAKQEDTLFLSAARPDNKGILILRGNPRHQLLTAAFNDSLQDYWVTKVQNRLQDLNQRWYWTFPGRPERAYFVSPAHVCRTHLMAINLWKNDEVDFRRPDSEGHLPLYFMARYAKDRLLIPSLAAQFNINANDSGRSRVTRQPFDAPLIRAIKYGNVYAIRGLEQLAPNNTDMNRRTELDLTPLMFAVLTAEDALARHGRNEITAQALKKHMWIVRFLAASMAVDERLTDRTGYSAADYAVSPRTQAALKAGIAQKNAFIGRFMPRI